jgi:hypothetical protein
LSVIIAVRAGVFKVFVLALGASGSSATLAVRLFKSLLL